MKSNEFENTELYFYHFGIKLNNTKVKKHMNKNNYYSTKNEKIKATPLAVANSKKNFDLNMKYFSNLNHSDFVSHLEKLVCINRFEEVKDLNKYNNLKGIYILVLDKYSQIYVGQTTRNLKERIINHWRNEVPLLKTPVIFSNILPIDCFGACDTNRIYVYVCNNQDEIDKIESSLINDFPEKYLLNKTVGGKAHNYKDVLDRLLYKRIIRDWENVMLKEIK